MSGTLPIFLVPKSVPKGGDHIFTNRRKLIAVYYHHGIYVGDDMVIHFGRSNDIPPCQNKNKKCDDKRVINNGITLTCLDCFLLGGDLFVFGYREFKLDLRVMLLVRTFSFAKSKPADEVVETTFKLLNKEGGFGNYDTANNNCEHFASYCKTGVGVSFQTRHLDKILKGRPELTGLVHSI